MIRIVIAEDQQMLRGAFKSLLSFEGDMEVIAEAEDGEAAWEAIVCLQPDVCLLDIEIPGLTGLEIAKRVKRSGNPAKVMIVTTFARPGYLQKAMELKLEGYLLKDEPIEFLIDAIRRVMAGDRVISKDLAEVLFLNEDNPLTERETEVLRLSHAGRTTREIAETLYLTEGTVRNYLSLAIQKLEVETRQQATERAKERGWI